jgi:O-antigen/teichoic acid export membrane protein
MNNETGQRLKLSAAVKEKVAALQGFRRIGQNSLLNISGVLIPASIAIVSTPILLRNLGPEAFGVFSLQLAVLILIGVNDFGVSRAVTLEAVARGGFSAPERLSRVVWAGIHIVTAIALLVVVASTVALFVSWLSFPLSLDHKISWGLLGPAAAISLVTLPLRAALEVQERFATANLLRIIGSSLLFAAPAMASFIEANTATTSLAMLFSRFALSVLAIISTRRIMAQSKPAHFLRIVFGFFAGNSTELHTTLLRRGGWLGSAGIASTLISYVDRFALGIFTAAVFVSHYVVASELVTKIWLVTGALTAAMTPRIAHYWNVKDEGGFSSLIFALLISHLTISLVSHICFVFFGDTIMRAWLGEQYDPSMAAFLAILSIGIAVNGISLSNYLTLVLCGRERELAGLQFIALPVTAIASFIAVKYWGAIGVAWVFTCRLIVDVFIVRALLRRTDWPGGGVGASFAGIALWVFLMGAIYAIAQI